MRRIVKTILSSMIYLLGMIGVLFMLFNIITIYLLYYGIEINTEIITTLLPYFLIPVAFSIILIFPLLWIISEVIFDDIKAGIKNANVIV